MTSLRRMRVNDVFSFNNVNLDVLTETYNMAYYMQYFVRWPNLMVVAESGVDHRIAGYIVGKAEGQGKNWHGHVTAVTVAPEHRRLALAHALMNYLEEVSDKQYHGYFVDLFVRASNNVAINMYKKFGYSIYRQVMDYYSGDEDAYDMRKALSRDVRKESVIPHNPFKVPPHGVT